MDDIPRTAAGEATTEANQPGPAGPSRDLGGHRGGHPERLDRAQHAETLVEAEHLARYFWIAPQAKGREVLDAGCGTAYGTGLIAAAGASAVTGVDRAGDVLDAVRGRMPETVELRSADLHELPIDDDSFDLVVCFEVLEHLERPEAGLDELARVLRPGGLLAVSSPNRDVYPPGNPHHVHEYAPDELSDSLARRFANVRLLRQHAWFSSAILGDEAIGLEDGAKIGARVAKTTSLEPGAETFTLGLASDGQLPEASDGVVLGPGIDQRALGEAARVAAEQAVQLGERTAQLVEARSRMVDAEQRLAELPALRGAKIELEGVKSSLSWRITAPLRTARRPARRAAATLRVRVKTLLAALLGRGKR